MAFTPPSNYPFNLEALKGYTDPVLTNAFNLIIPVVPGSSGPQQSLMLQLQTVDNPIQFTNKPVAFKMGRFKYNYAGAQSWKQDLKATFAETTNGNITTILQNWRNSTVDYDSGLNYAKSNYTTTGILYVFGVNGNTVFQYKMNNLWLSSFSVSEGFKQDSDANTQMIVNAGFTFDFLDNPIQIGG